MAHEVFISYAKDDWQTADVVCKALEDEGFRCWYAPRDVLPGAAFEDAIVAAISESRLMLLILSAHANNSRFVRRECACADDEGVPILPFRVEDVRPSGALRLYLSSVQWLDAFAPPLESHLERLIKSVRIRLQREAERLRALEEAAQARAEEEARRKAEEEATRRAEEERQRREEAERQRQEAERKLKEEEAERQRALEEAARLKAEDEARQRAEEAQAEKRQREEQARLVHEAEEAERRDAAEQEQKDKEMTATQSSPNSTSKVPKTVIAPTQRTDEPVSQNSPAIATLKVAQPDSFSREALSGASRIDPHKGTPANKNRRIRLLIGGMIAATFVVIIIATSALIQHTGTSGNQTANQNQQPSLWLPLTRPVESSHPPDTNKSPTPPAGMAYIPGGTFMMGRDAGDEYEHPAHEVIVKSFFIDIYEVTNEDYELFVMTTDRLRPMTWTNGRYPAGAAHKPVTGVNWNDATAYCEKAGKRLPTEEEWEFAARGGKEERRYPWGNDWRAGLANANGASSSTADVGTYKGASPFGAFDMVGNAWEWTDSKLTAYKKGQPLPNKPPGDLRVIRGGSYIEDKDEATTTYRRGYPVSGVNYDKTGFRCVKDVTDSSGQN